MQGSIPADHPFLLLNYVPTCPELARGLFCKQVCFMHAVGSSPTVGFCSVFSSENCLDIS